MEEINRCRRLIMIGAGTSFHIAIAVSCMKLVIVRFLTILGSD